MMLRIIRSNDFGFQAGFISLSLFVLLYLIFCLPFLQAADVGGSIAIHTYGAYFGLGVSLAYKGKKSTTEAVTDSATVPSLNGPNYTSDVTAMIGKLNIDIVDVVYFLLNDAHLMVKGGNTAIGLQKQNRTYQVPHSFRYLASR